MHNTYPDPGVEARINRLEQGNYSNTAADSALIFTIGVHRMSGEQVRKLRSLPGERSTVEQALSHLITLRRADSQAALCPCGADSCCCENDTQ